MNALDNKSQTASSLTLVKGLQDQSKSASLAINLYITRQLLAGNVPLGHCAGERVGVRIRGTFSIQPMVTRTAMGLRQVLSPFSAKPVLALDSRCRLTSA